MEPEIGALGDWEVMEATIKLIEAEIPRLRRYARFLVGDGDRADDVVQECLAKAIAKVDSWQPGTNLRAWLFTILRNNYYSSRRKLNREVADVDGVFTETLSVKPDHDGRMQLADFKVAFETLPDEQREALILVGASGFSYEEAAEMCGVAIGTIKSRANRGRAKLTELLHLDEDEPMEMTDAATMSVISSAGTLPK